MALARCLFESQQSLTQDEAAECHVALAKSWRECGSIDRLIKALAKGPVSD